MNVPIVESYGINSTLIEDIADEHFGEEQRRPKKKNAASTKVKWSYEEEEEIKTILKSFFQNKKRPTPAQCVKAISISKKNGGLLGRRKKDVLKKKVFRMIDGLK